MTDSTGMPPSRDATVVAIEQDATAGHAEIRTPRHGWVQVLVLSGFYLTFAAFFWASPAQFWPGSWFAWFWLVMGCAMVVEALWLRTRGVDLTDGSAVLVGFRRRTIAWHDVQAVIRTRRSGTWVVRLVPASGKPVTLHAPTTWGPAAAAYERDFRRIDQWWLTHRGPSGSPAPPGRELR
jgi:hypothetical protein